MKRPYYGWNIVAYSVGCGMVLAGATQMSFGLYVVPVSQEFGLRRADMNTAIIMMNMGAALFSPLVGWLSDRIPIRPMLILGAVFVATSFIAMSLSHSILLSAGLIVMLVAGMDLGLRPAAVLTVRWFEANRGRALTIGAMGLSLASIVVAPLMGLLMGAYDWRTCLRVSGVVGGLVVLLPSLFLRMRPTAEEAAREARGRAMPAESEAPADSPIRISTLLRTPQFWCIGLALAIPASVSQAVVISITPMAVQSGIPVAQAATFVSAAGVMAITGKVGLAVIADKANQMVLLTAAFLVGALENLLLFAVVGHASYPVLLACSLLQGLSSGLLIPLFSALIAKLFGPASFGTVFGLTFPIISVMNAIFARYVGEVYDRTGGYGFAFASFVACELFAALLMISAMRFPPPRVSDGPEPVRAAA